ncbi:hypothetical protein ACTHSJ_26255 [Paenibacillus cellulositrophicus]|uniref:hypothetical protein n=1 Tax=Paenibacillus cellulositrophicus TaxID=562959 RepID=UPI00203D9BFB|nr:hypothetical protein [Paenibacillus cellulositrophicus]MCM3001285.1 hypothetical protein [Paenibacillus cellulositrophicus]
MSTINEHGENISRAVKVLRTTYKNLTLLMGEMDMVGKELGFVPLGPKFLRWKSDSYEEAWLLSDFIKIYQMEGASAGNDRVSDLKEGPVFVVEIDLEGQDGYPEITLSRFHYDLSMWERVPAVSDHWLFQNPYWLDNHFEITYNDGIWRSRTKDKSFKKYWGLQQAIGKSIPLTSVSDVETIKTNIFKELLDLPEA